jgi:hypothetical protein
LIILHFSIYGKGGSFLASGNYWVVSANMGLGHQRATYPLREIAYGGIHLFGEDHIGSASEGRLWKLFLKSYEYISRTRQLPVIGPSMFSILEKLQNISPYYPFRDQSQPSLQLKSLYSMIRRGMGHGLCSKLLTGKKPVITSFYASAIAAEELTDLPIYCIICDSDINRVWVAQDPRKSRIVYFTPCGRAMRRLKQYGVPDERIFLTGFPLPLENVGDKSMNILRYDLRQRLVRLDPAGRFRIIHGEEVKHYLGCQDLIHLKEQPLTVTYVVGGAGAQTEIAYAALESLAPLIKQGKIALNLVAGIRSKVYRYFVKLTKKAGMTDDKRLRIVYHSDINEYFREFSQILHSTDLLWTKPSELSFYCGLGIPIIIAPPIGPHEVANRRWLRELGAGIPQEDPRYCGEWIKDYFHDGHFAQAAWDGFLYARKMGVYKIQEVLDTNTLVREVSPVRR